MDLNQVTIPSLDLDRSVAFYLLLGLRLIVDARPRYVRFEVPDGNSTLSLHLAEQLPSGSGITVYFEDEDMDAKVSSLIDAGIKFDRLPEDMTWLWREAHLSDPDGNRLIIYHAGENRKDPPWKVG